MRPVGAGARHRKGALGAGARHRKGAVGTGARHRKGALGAGARHRKGALGAGARYRKGALGTGARHRKGALGTGDQLFQWAGTSRFLDGWVPTVTLAAVRAATQQWRRYATDEQWRALVLDGLPAEIVARTLGEAAEIEAAPRKRGPGALSPVALGNQHIGATAAALAGIDFELIESEAAIRDRAERFALACVDWPAGADVLCQVAGIELPTGRNMTPTGVVARLRCPRWWRRRLRAALGQRAENKLRCCGHVRRGRAPYVSDYSLRRRREQRARGRDAMEAARLVNGEGTQLELLEVAKGSLSNPTVRRYEFMVRARGFEEIARDKAHDAMFLTLTAPSAFHPQLACGGANPAYEATRGAVGDARGWFQRQWARARAKLKRMSVHIYGFRIAEPHHDGTPHWHLLLFGTSETLDAAWAVISGYWCAEYQHELTSDKAREARAKRVDIDRERGSAAGYVAKYIGKNLDGAGIEDEGDFEAALPAEDGAERVEAWASTHRVRQFQQVGGPPVGLWRELRRLRSPIDDPAIEPARLAADAADWRGFIRAVGGIDSGRNTTLRVWKETTGELNTYGELRGPQPAGVASGAGRIRTREARWRIVWGRGRNGADRRAANLRDFPNLGLVEITVRGAAPHHSQRGCTNSRLASGQRQPECAVRQLE